MKQSSFTLRTNFTIGLICVRNKKSWTESNELCFYKATLNSHNRLFLLFLAAWMHYKGAGVSTHLVGTSLFGGSNPPPSHSHWPDFHWNVSKPWLQEVDLFENYATVAMQSDNVTFFIIQDNKSDIRLQFEENNFFHQVAPPSKKQLKYFSNTNNSTTLMLAGSPGVSREAKLSTEFEFDSLVR